MDVARHVYTFCKTYIATSEPIVLAVSGGMDSMVLLHVLLSEPALLATRAIHVVHVDHALRSTSTRDADFVRSYCVERDIPVHVVQVTVSRTEASLEQAARNARYEALMRVANDVNSKTIVLAHHQRDQIETFLIRALRGSALQGLAAMRQASLMRGVRLLRPLLQVPHHAIEAYAQRHRVPFVYDETNDDERFLRNALRKRVVSELERLEPNAGHAIGKLTEQIQVDNDYLHTLTMEASSRVVKRRWGDGVEIDVRMFRELPVSLQRRVIHILLNCFADGDWRYEHVVDIVELASPDARPSASLAIAHGMRAWRQYDSLYIGHFSTQSNNESAGVTEWNVTETTRLTLQHGTTKWRFRAYASNAFGPFRGSNWRLFLPDVQRLRVEQGTKTHVRVRPLGLSGSKKLQDLYTERKIPRHLRHVWPVFWIGDEIVWIPGVVRSDAYLMNPQCEGSGWVIFGHFCERPPNRRKVGTCDGDFSV